MPGSSQKSTSTTDRTTNETTRSVNNSTSTTSQSPTLKPEEETVAMPKSGSGSSDKSPSTASSLNTTDATIGSGSGSGSGSNNSTPEPSTPPPPAPPRSSDCACGGTRHPGMYPNRCPRLAPRNVEARVRWENYSPVTAANGICQACNQAAHAISRDGGEVVPERWNCRG